MNIGLLIFGALLSIAGAFWWPLVLLSYVAILFTLFRALSKNIPARQKELAVFLRFWSPVKNWGILQKRKYRERKAYKYFKCPSCRQNLRAPRGRGKITVTCQKCHNQFISKT